MARDYAKLKALAQEIICCIGDEEEGEDPKIPKSKQERDLSKSLGSQHPGPHENESQGDQEPLLDFTPAAEDNQLLPDKFDSANGKEEGNRKKRKDDIKALLASTLASKFNK